MSTTFTEALSQAINDWNRATPEQRIEACRVAAAAAERAHEQLLASSRKTMGNHTQDEFNEALKVWLEDAQAISDQNMRDYPNVTAPILETMNGPKRIRVVATTKVDGEVISRSAHTFIDKATGDVLKPDGWKRPARHPRGNIFDEHNGLRGMSAYGPAYLR